MKNLAITALAASAAALLSAAPASAQGKTLTISWWGFNGEKLESIILAPFREQCGCEIVFETGNNGERLNKIQIRNGGGVDVAYFSDSFSQQGIEAGLFQKIDPAKLPNLAGIYDLAKDPQGGERASVDALHVRNDPRADPVVLPSDSPLVTSVSG